MLPTELLNVILGALSRDDLDALMLTNALFRDVVARDFAKEPFRYFKELNIREYQPYTAERAYRVYLFTPVTGRTSSCRNDDDFCRRLRLARIGKLG